MRTMKKNKSRILVQIEAEFDTHIYNGYNQYSHTSLCYAEAIFELAKSIDMLDEFDVKDWQCELKHLKDYLEIQGE